jgi:hypothetical protein
MSMNVLKAIALAEIRHAELLEQAEQLRLAQRAVDTRRRGKPWDRGVRNGLAAMRARTRAIRRPGLTKPANLAPEAAETT